jgi:hypothetical protein
MMLSSFSYTIGIGDVLAYMYCLNIKPKEFFHPLSSRAVPAIVYIILRTLCCTLPNIEIIIVYSVCT